MKCPFCNIELLDNGIYGYLALHQSGEVLGRIFKCPNSDGFESEELAKDYLLLIGETLNKLCLSSWEEVTCESYKFYVSGSFYTDKHDNLHEGYPC
jgi:hypothetical protein